ncbi:hypothetical protein G3A39_39035 [Paraburkholderia aspalathi]|nr:hypothetical protein [Paraburkholderia aspalathi]
MNPQHDRPDLTRRLLLFGIASAYTVSWVPWSLAEAATDGEFATFMALSAVLSGHETLDEAHGQRLYAALVADDPDFPKASKSLLDIIQQRTIDPLQLQKLLDGENTPLAALPQRILTAWYMGIVGDGPNARCLAFETALNAQAVADVLRPPTYAYGAYGSWTRNPI